MTGIEILNALQEQRSKLTNQTFLTFVELDKYDELLFSFTGGLHQVGKDEYLKMCIQSFLLHAEASKEDDILQGYENAKKVISTKHGLGKTEDIYFKVPIKESSKTHRIRISVNGDRAYDESTEIAQWQSMGTYLIVKSFNDFYNWYVKEFGEITI